MDEKPKRRWFQWRLSTLLWLVLVVSLAISLAQARLELREIREAELLQRKLERILRVMNGS